MSVISVNRGISGYNCPAKIMASTGQQGKEWGSGQEGVTGNRGQGMQNRREARCSVRGPSTGREALCLNFPMLCSSAALGSGRPLSNTFEQSQKYPEGNGDRW